MACNSIISNKRPELNVNCCRCGENPGAARESIYSSDITLPIYCLFILCWTINTCSAPTPVIGEVSSVLFSGNLSGKVTVSSKQECYVDQGRWRQWRAQVTSHSLLLSLRLTNQQFAQLPQPAPLDTGHSRNVKFLTVHIQFTSVKTTGLKCWWGGYGVNLFVWLGRSLVTKVEPSCSLLICDSAAWPRWIVKY